MSGLLMPDGSRAPGGDLGLQRIPGGTTADYYEMHPGYESRPAARRFNAKVVVTEGQPIEHDDPFLGIALAALILATAVVGFVAIRGSRLALAALGLLTASLAFVAIHGRLQARYRKAERAQLLASCGTYVDAYSASQGIHMLTPRLGSEWDKIVQFSGLADVPPADPK